MKTGGSLKAVKVIPGESRRHAPGARLGLHVSLDVKAARVCSAFIFLPLRSSEPRITHKLMLMRNGKANFILYYTFLPAPLLP